MGNPITLFRGEKKQERNTQGLNWNKREINKIFRLFELKKMIKEIGFSFQLFGD